MSEDKNRHILKVMKKKQIVQIIMKKYKQEMFNKILPPGYQLIKLEKKYIRNKNNKNSNKKITRITPNKNKGKNLANLKRKNKKNQKASSSSRREKSKSKIFPTKKKFSKTEKIKLSKLIQNLYPEDLIEIHKIVKEGEDFKDSYEIDLGIMSDDKLEKLKKFVHCKISEFGGMKNYIDNRNKKSNDWDEDDIKVTKKKKN